MANKIMLAVDGRGKCSKDCDLYNQVSFNCWKDWDISPKTSKDDWVNYWKPSPDCRLHGLTNTTRSFELCDEGTEEQIETLERQLDRDIKAMEKFSHRVKVLERALEILWTEAVSYKSFAEQADKDEDIKLAIAQAEAELAEEAKGENDG